MKIKNKEKFCRNVIANAVIGVFLVVFVLTIFINSLQKKTVTASNSEYNGTIYAGDKNSKNVSLMVNVYWGNEYLEKMLETFDKYEIKTTFFVGGKWALENQLLLQKLTAKGHEIASHGYSHKDHSKLGYEENLIEIQKCHSVVKDVSGVEMELFAPPSGAYNKSTIKAATELGYKTIMWTRDTIDWRDKDAGLIYNRAVTGLAGGDLILMHPTKCTAEALEQIIKHIMEKGFNVTTVSQTLSL